MRSLHPRRTKLLTSGLIALTSLLGAVGAWRASVAADTAGAAERKGFADSITRAQVRASALIQADGSFLDFVRVVTYEAESSALRDAAATAEPEDRARLEAQANAAAGLAREIRRSISSEALRPDGTLDLERQFDVELALRAGLLDLEPGPDFDEADRLNLRAERLVGLTALFIAAALFLTLAQFSRTRAQATYLAGGVAVLVAASGLLLIVDVL